MTIYVRVDIFYLQNSGSFGKTGLFQHPQAITPTTDQISIVGEIAIFPTLRRLPAGPSSQRPLASVSTVASDKIKNKCSTLCFRLVLTGDASC
jgi:hypothetical protein